MAPKELVAHLVLIGIPRVPCWLHNAQIQVKELYAVLQALLCWGEHWHGCHVVFHVDNSAVVVAIDNHSTQSCPTLSPLHLIVMIATCLDMSFSSSWLLSLANTIADAASHYQYKQLVMLAPSTPGHLRWTPSSLVSNAPCTLD